jgi:H/ACA ribonucleoprotein complex subunit 3
MHLRYYLDANGKRVYTLKLTLPDGSYTLNAHPGNAVN